MTETAAPHEPAAPPLERLPGRWRRWLGAWRRWSLWALLLALVASMLVTLVWLAGRYEAGEVQSRLERDSADAVADIRNAFAHNLQNLQALQAGDPDLAIWESRAGDLLTQRRELVRIEWRDTQLQLRAHAQTPYRPQGRDPTQRASVRSETALACANARRITGPSYSTSYFQPMPDGVGAEMMEVCLPLMGDGRNHGFLVATYALHTVLQELVAPHATIMALARQVQASGSSISDYGVELTLARGEVVNVDCHLCPIPELPGHVLVVLHPCSVARRLDQQISHRRSTRSVAGLAATLAHEVKNPLSGIRGAAQLLEPAVGEDDRPLIQLICDETDRICALVERMEEFLAMPAKNGAARYQTRLQLALDYAENGKPRKAREVLIRAAEDDWSRVEHWLWLGDLAMQDERFEEALQFYRYATTSINDPPFSLWWIDEDVYTYLPAQRMTMVLAELGRLKEALEWARKVIALFPDEVPAEARDEAEAIVKQLEDAARAS